jgi:hypothetical protein
VRELRGRFQHPACVGPVAVAGGELREGGFHHLPGFEQFAVGRAGQVVVKARGAAEAGRVDLADDGAAAWAAADREESLDFEQAEPFA